jgi:hypothetical protein
VREAENDPTLVVQEPNPQKRPTSATVPPPPPPAHNDTLLSAAAHVAPRTPPHFLCCFVQVEVSVPVRYPLDAPDLRLCTPVWHPNVDLAAAGAVHGGPWAPDSSLQVRNRASIRTVLRRACRMGIHGLGKSYKGG